MYVRACTQSHCVFIHTRTPAATTDVTDSSLTKRLRRLTNCRCVPCVRRFSSLPNFLWDRGYANRASRPNTPPLTPLEPDNATENMSYTENSGLPNSVVSPLSSEWDVLVVDSFFFLGRGFDGSPNVFGTSPWRVVRSPFPFVCGASLYSLLGSGWVGGVGVVVVGGGGGREGKGGEREREGEPPSRRYK